MIDPSAQFLDFAVSQSRQNENNPYRRLLWGIFLDALYICTLPARTTAQKKQLARDVEWVHSPSDAAFSFVWVCHCLGLDPGWVRRGRI